MAKYPDTPKAYPASPKAYPASPKAYPGTVNSYPSGTPPVVSTPLTILGSDAELWLKASLGITIGTGVSAWADQSGNGHDFPQATGAAQPALEATGYAGKPSVLFDGVDDVLVNTTLAGTLPGGTDTPFSLYLWVQYVTAATTVVFGAGNSGAANPFFQLFYNTTGPTWGIAKRDSAGVQKVGGGGVASTGETMLEVHFNGTNSCVIAANGVESAPFDLDVGLTTLNSLSLGALVRTATTSFSNCRIAEVVLASTVSTAGQRTDMRAYGASEYP
jgi:hypothetical protein